MNPYWQEHRMFIEQLLIGGASISMLADQYRTSPQHIGKVLKELGLATVTQERLHALECNSGETERVRSYLTAKQVAYQDMGAA